MKNLFLFGVENEGKEFSLWMGLVPLPKRAKIKGKGFIQVKFNNV